MTNVNHIAMAIARHNHNSALPVGGQTGMKRIKMKIMQSYRIDTDTIKKIDEIAKMDQRSNSNVIEKAVTEYYKKLEDKMKDDRVKVLYDGEVLGRITTNRSLTIDEALSLIGVNPFEMDGGDPKWDYELFELVY